MTTPRFYVACLASYNNGILHGAWIEASTDVEEMQSEIASMLRQSPCPNVTVKCDLCSGKGQAVYHNSETGDTRLDTCPSCGGKGMVPSAEEWAIHDSEGLGDIGEYVGLNHIAFLMALDDIADDKSVPFDVMAEFADWLGSDDPDDIASDFDDYYAGEFSAGCEGDWAADQAEGMGFEVPDWIGHFRIDWDGIARDWLMDYHKIEADGTVYLFHNH